jgi:hypothetical protein
MLGYYSMSASLMPSEIFYCRFDLLEVCFLQVVTRPLFVRQDYTGRLLRWLVLFTFLDRRACYSTRR